MIRVSGSTQEFLFNPTKIKSYQQSSFIQLFLENLVDINTDGQIVSALAKKWEITEDGRLYKFFIDEKALFHDGSKITARDIEYSLCLHFNPELDSILKVYLENLLENPIYDEKNKKCPSINVLDDKTLTIKLKGAYPPFLSDIAQPGFGIIPQNFNEKNPIGSGPYKLNSISKDGIIILNYFEKFYKSKKFNPTFTFQIIREKNDIIKAFHENKIDVSLGAPIDLIEGGIPNEVSFKYLNGLVSTNIYVNGKSSIFQKSDIRSDLCKLITQLRNDKTLFTPYDITLNTYLPAGIMPKSYYEKKIDIISPKDFKEKHKINGTKIKVVIPKHIFTERFILKFKNLLTEVGFDPTYIEEKGKFYLEPIEKGLFDLVFIPFMGLGTDPDGYLAVLDPSGFLKNANIGSDKLMSEMKKYRFNSNPELRLKKYEAFMSEYENLNYVIPLIQQHLPFLYRKNISTPDFNYNNHTILREFIWNEK